MTDTPWNDVLDYYDRILEVSRPRYECWDGGPINHEGSPAWAVDRPAPRPGDVDQMFCAGLLQLGRRRLGFQITKHATMNIYDGGMRSITDFFVGHFDAFRLSEFRRGDVAVVPYALRGPDFEGHVGVASGGPDEAFYQSFAWTCRYLEPGLTRRYTLRESHDGGFYTLRLPREIAWRPRSEW